MVLVGGIVERVHTVLVYRPAASPDQKQWQCHYHNYGYIGKFHNCKIRQKSRITNSLWQHNEKKQEKCKYPTTIVKLFYKPESQTRDGGHTHPRLFNVFCHEKPISTHLFSPFYLVKRHITLTIAAVSHFKTATLARQKHHFCLP